MRADRLLMQIAVEGVEQIGNPTYQMSVTAVALYGTILLRMPATPSQQIHPSYSPVYKLFILFRCTATILFDKQAVYIQCLIDHAGLQHEICSLLESIDVILADIQGEIVVVVQLVS